jgi:chromosome segregation ATPase
MSIISDLREKIEEKQTALQVLRDKRDALIAANEKFITEERALAKQIKEAQLELAPLMNELGEIRREVLK